MERAHPPRQSVDLDHPQQVAFELLKETVSKTLILRNYNLKEEVTPSNLMLHNLGLELLYN